MKKLMVCLAFVCCLTQANSQLYIRAFNYRPTGEFGFVMKPAFSLEIGKTDSFEDNKLRFNYSATFLIMKPRMEVFPVYGTLTDGSGTYVMPGEQKFNKYNILNIYGGIDYKFIDHDSWSPFIGFDIVVGAASVDYTHSISGISESSYSGGGILGGLRFRVGVEYAVSDKMGLFFSANRQGFLISEPAGLFGANDYGLGIRIAFN